MIFNFSIDRSKIIKRDIDAGEDAPPVSHVGVLVVCDGTGATGQSKHEINGTSYTSAYLGSRQTSLATKEYLESRYDEIVKSMANEDNIKAIAEELGDKIRDALNSYVNEYNLTLNVRGRSFRLLPTTLAAAVYKVSQNRVEVVTFSAGDSRILFWDQEKGLQQLSIDDIDAGYDAFSDVSNTNNCISADNSFKINYSIFTDLSPKGMLIATSDGFTDPIKPFDQERYLLQWLGKANNILDPEKSVVESDIGMALDSMGFTKKDDCSIAGVIFGYESDEELKSVMLPRFTYVAEAYVKPYYKIDKECKEAIDAYNFAGNERRKLTENIRRQIQNKLLENVQLLLPDYYSTNMEVYDFLASQSFINKEIVAIRDEATKKRVRAQAQFDNADRETKSAFLEMLKQYSFVALKDGTNIGLPIDISVQLKSYMENKAKRTRLCVNYNNALQRIRSLPNYNESTNSILSVSDINNMCNELSTCASDLNRIVTAGLEAERNIDDFFSMNNYQINELFERHKKTGFVEFDRFIESIKPSRGRQLFGIFGTRERDETEDCFKRLSALRATLSRAYNNALSAQKKLEEATLSNEERLHRYREIIKSHMNELVNAVYDSPEMFLFFVGMPKNDFDKKIQANDIVSDRAHELIELKNQLWKKYKVSYEAFANSLNGQVEIKKRSELLE